MATLKRKLALFLILAMMLSMFPVSAFADADSTPPEAAVLSEVNEPAPAPASAEVPTEISEAAEAAQPAEATEPTEDTKPAEAAESTEAAQPAEGSESDDIENSDDTAGEETPAPDIEEESADASTEEAPADSTTEPADEASVEVGDDSQAESGEEAAEEEPGIMLFSTLRSTEDTCAHANTATETDSSMLPVYKSVSDTQHGMYTYKFDYCLDCYKVTVENRLVESDLYFDHDLDSSGVCTVCGYSGNSNPDSGSDSDCTHANTDTRWDTSYHIVERTAINATHHKVSGYKSTYCTECLENIGESYPAEETEDHSFSQDRPGWCQRCGYCSHPSTTTEWVSHLFYTKVNCKQHIISGIQRTYCDSCGHSLSDFVGTEELEDHTADSLGDCTLCFKPIHGYKEMVLESYSSTILSDTECKSTYYYHDRCADCFEILSESYAIESTSPHSSDIYGTCDRCGYNKKSIGCKHNNSENGWIYADTILMPDYADYIGYNDEQHYVLKKYYMQCTLCQARLGDTYGKKELVAHVFDNSGKCTLCQYTIGGCTHENLMWSGYYNCTPLNDKQCIEHSTRTSFCEDCDKILKDDINFVSTHPHQLDSSGVCTCCGYGSEAKAECSHTETTSKLHDHSYAVVDKDYHESTRLYSKVCADPDCGEVLAEVEPSYTETLKEKHDFTDGKCGLCGYTKTDDLSVTVSADIQSATKGDRISATAAASGGSGGYKYGWKVLLDGAVIAETDMGYGPSYDYLATTEGSYAFIVTVIDSEGNKASAQCEVIGVASHECVFETIIVSSELSDPTQTHHTLKTVSYTECSICHEKTDTVETTVQEEHKPIDANRYHEAAHPHKVYFICECGGHPYIEGEYETVNGNVLDETECCLCDNHKYGDLIQETELVNSGSTTMHNKVTSSHRECVNCGKETNAISVTLEEEHSPKSNNSYGYKTAHPHAKYYVCECGGEIVIDGQYNTVNGKVQEPGVCCICNGHAFGEAKQDAAGNWKKTCANCGTSQNAAAPVVEEHVHQFERITYGPYKPTEHPHEYKAVCSCGKIGTVQETYLNCCECVGHNWDITYADGYLYKNCMVCKESVKEAVMGSDSWNEYRNLTSKLHEYAKKYIEHYEPGVEASSVWRILASQATNKLTDDGFVKGVVLLETVENKAATLVGKNDKIISAEQYEENQINLWKALITEMLTDESNSANSKEYDNLDELAIIDKIDKSVSAIDYMFGISDSIDNSATNTAKYVAELKDWSIEIRTKQEIFTEHLGVSTDPNYNLNLKDAATAKLKADKLDDILEGAEESLKGKNSLNTLAKSIPWIFASLSAIVEGSEAETKVKELQTSYALMADDYANDLIALKHIISDAEKMGNEQLAEAARQIKAEVEYEFTMRIGDYANAASGLCEAAGDFFEAEGAFWTNAAGKFFEGAADIALGKISGGGFDATAFWASILKVLTNANEVYEEAAKLMMMSDMSSSCDFTKLSKDGNVDDSPYTYELWAELQKVGCDQAINFVSKLADKGHGQVLITDFGIEVSERNDVYRELGDDIEEYDNFIKAVSTLQPN